MGLHDEISEQPAVLSRLAAQARPGVLDIGRALRDRDIDMVYIVARGSSDNAGLFAKYLFGSHNHLPVAMALPSLFTMYAAPPRLKRALVIGISQSGQSPDIVLAVAEAKRQGAPTVVITNDPDSPLAAQGEFVIDIAAGDESAVAATKTYTAQLMAIAMLSAGM
ncbi:MAG: SIS domain-containing protein, partial [Planctomycetes bacterium]|nr:SIS domain-containing protein [Planctomycetota bacterium]